MHLALLDAGAVHEVAITSDLPQRGGRAVVVILAEVPPMRAARILNRAHIDDSKPRTVVVGTDIKVAQIAWEHEYHGMTPDEIVSAHPHLSLANVHGALAYFYDHAEEIRADWHESDRVIEEMQKLLPAAPLKPRPGA